MASLTKARLEKARLILDRYKKDLLETQRMNVGLIEKELKEAWGSSYQAIKGTMMDLLKDPNYELVAARYMEDGAPGVPVEFKTPLAKLYGIARYDSDEREQKQSEFWERAFAGTDS